MKNLIKALEFIDPSLCSYQEWINVGMALKHEGYSVQAWDVWSARDSARYHDGECERKWKSFNGSSTPVTAGTIVRMARDNGMNNINNIGNELEWEACIGEENMIVSTDKKHTEEIIIPEEWNPSEQIVKYLETLFKPSDKVGYVTECRRGDDGRWLPKRGAYDRTAAELIRLLKECNGDIGSVLGDYSSEAGAWIRFNPLDGRGVKNENVTEYRFALVESDSLDINEQNAIIRELELPVACLVYSGKKSLHAIVRINASNYDEYKQRVDFLYSVCEKNGLQIDKQNRNPSRLSRLPGVVRGTQKQYLLDTNIGMKSWYEWEKWTEGLNDELPDMENMEKAWDNTPPLSPPLIENILRQGHKMLIAGPSKAGKSFALIELCIAIAEGRSWFGNKCAKGRVLYVNLELDRASCLHRFKGVYNALQYEIGNLNNIDIWNLRGRTLPLDRLAPSLIRRSLKRNYIAVIIDPIYKVITGDENSADQMAAFCNQFDKICTELDCAVIYCHHHSKGAQGGKRSIDRASGSGVFARDPDALLDMIELELDEKLLKAEEDKAICEVCGKWLTECGKGELTEDNASAVQALRIARKELTSDLYECVTDDVAKLREEICRRTAWRIECTLREFPKPKPINVWFEYPIHKIDSSGALKNAVALCDIPQWKKAADGRKSTSERKEERNKAFENAFEVCNSDGRATVGKLAEYMKVSEKTIRSRVKDNGGFWIDDGEIGKKS